MKIAALLIILTTAQTTPPPFDFIGKFKGKVVTASPKGLSKADFELVKKMFVRWSFTADIKQVRTALEAELKRKGWQSSGKPASAFRKGTSIAYFYPSTHTDAKGVSCTFEYAKDITQ